MHLQETAHIEIYQVLDGVLDSGVVLPGSRGKVFAVIDRLRDRNAQSCERALAEQVSVELYRLEQSLQRAEQGEVELARRALRDLAGQWLERRIATI